MSETYKDLIHSDFPDKVSSLLNIRDPKASEISLINQYNTYMASGNINAATNMFIENPELQQCIINAYIILKLHHDIIAVQRTFNDNVNGYITKMKDDSVQEIQNIEQEYENKVNSKYNELATKVDNSNSDVDDKLADAKEQLQIAVQNFENYILSLSSYQGDFDSKKTYKKFQVVTYKVGETINAYMVVADETTGNLPTSDSFVPITLKGDKGETGTGLAPRGVYNASTTYYVNDMVSYNQKLWFAKKDNFSGKTPSDGSIYWESFLVLSQSSNDINMNDGTTLQTCIENMNGVIEEYNTRITKLENAIGDLKFSVVDGILCCTYDDGE